MRGNNKHQKISNKKKILLVILILSLLFNFMVVLLDTIPFIYHRYDKRFVTHEKSILNTSSPEKTIVKRALEMSQSKDVAMVWREQTSFTKGILNLRNFNKDKSFRRFNYPRAFLISGLTDYARSKKDTVLMLKVAEIFNRYMNKDGSPTFTFDKVDQVPFGVAAINLYLYTNDIRFKKFANFIYNKLLSLQETENSIILYRPGQKQQLSDVLGMICPFLIRYDEISNSKASDLAQKQLQYFINYGVDKETFLPTHGINLDTNIKIGPVNWGRGIGWYIIALSEFVKHKGIYSMELDCLINTLNNLKTPELFWTQFPGLSERFDASSTTMFMYAINTTHPHTYSKESVLKILGSYIDSEGKILSTSGDTYGVNDYSRTFGDSELSQGILLMLLSTINNPK